MTLCRVVDNTCRYCGRRDGEIALCSIVQKPKKSNFEIRKEITVFPDYEYECFYCGFLYGKDKHRNLSWRTRDHIIPISKGGRNNKSNIVLCCYKCNRQKGSLMPISFLLSGYLNEERVGIVKRKLGEIGIITHLCMIFVRFIVEY